MIKSIFKKTLIAVSLFTGSVNAQQLRPEAFSLLNLDYPGLEQVKALHQEGKNDEAAKALLEYYRNRKGINHPDIDLSKKATISKQEQKWADDALDHTFFVHKGYQPSFNYGKDINWQYWPVEDNELRWQLHRHKWFSSLGKAYRVSGDEKYAQAWVNQYMDWIEKNPLLKIKKSDYELPENRDKKSLIENVRFAWRPLEVSHRLQDQPGQLMYFIPSANFTPEFLTEFLVNYHRHAVHILNNYSDQGNHLLFEAQRMIYAGAFFPEFKEALGWRKSGIDVLNREIEKQVYDDGGQYELDPHYHLASINIFYKGIQVAEVNGFKNEFPAKYLETVEKMITVYINYCFPDYTNPCFSDAKLTKKAEVIKDFKKWAKVFPENKQILYFASEGKKGEKPAYLSNAFKTSGFYIFRNSWNQDANMMVVKAGPKAFWHCQPDNGTFELWFKGENLFPDSGSFVYAGNDEVMKWRNWFRQTRVHNTLTLDNKNLETTHSVLKLWDGEGEIQTLVTENPSYKDLKHRRSIFFVDNSFYVIVDEAVGAAQGDVDVHYHLCEGKVNFDKKNNALTTDFEGINVKLQCFGEKGLSMNEEEGWRSTAYRHKVERTSVAFNVNKQKEGAVRFITVIYPTEEGKTPEISASFKNKKFNEKALDLQVKINKKKYNLNYTL